MQSLASEVTAWYPARCPASPRWTEPGLPYLSPHSPAGPQHQGAAWLGAPAGTWCTKPRLGGVNGLAFHRDQPATSCREPLSFHSQEQGDQEPGLQPAEGQQAKAHSVPGRAEPQETWQHTPPPPPKGCAGDAHQVSACFSPSSTSSASTQQTRV